MTNTIAKPLKNTVDCIFGDFKNGEELVSHFFKIWGDAGWFHAWRVYMDAESTFNKNGLTRKQNPDLYDFLDSLFDALAN